VTKAVVQLMRDLGATPAPLNSFLLATHLESLALRMKRHCDNALAVATFLEGEEGVSWVSYPGLPGNKYHALAQKYMPNGTCGVISFGIKGGKQKATAFMDSLKLCSIATHVADGKTCVLHPAGTTHRQMTDEQLAEAGVSPDLIRLSVGIENAEDIIADIRQGLACAK
jgi:O-acetylhomoserine (thiol)-lyase